jgi:hypothetical protein
MDTVQRDWMKALVTASLPMMKRAMPTLYTESYDFVVSLWGSKKFVDQRLPQLTEFYLEGALMGMGITDELQKEVMLKMLQEALK